jgi:hypothetical protein
MVNRTDPSGLRMTCGWELYGEFDGTLILYRLNSFKSALKSARFACGMCRCFSLNGYGSTNSITCEISGTVLRLLKPVEQIGSIYFNISLLISSMSMSR